MNRLIITVFVPIPALVLMYVLIFIYSDRFPFVGYINAISTLAAVGLWTFLPQRNFTYETIATEQPDSLRFAVKKIPYVQEVFWVVLVGVVLYSAALWVGAHFEERVLHESIQASDYQMRQKQHFSTTQRVILLSILVIWYIPLFLLRRYKAYYTTEHLWGFDPATSRWTRNGHPENILSVSPAQAFDPHGNEVWQIWAQAPNKMLGGGRHLLYETNDAAKHLRLMERLGQPQNA